MSDLIITTENSIANDSFIKINPGTINQFVTPSTVRKEKEAVQASHISFAIDLQLTPASATNQEDHIISQGNDVEDIWLGNEASNKDSGRTHDRNHLSHWQDQESEDNNYKHTIMLNSSKNDGVFMKACIELNCSENIIMEAKTAYKFNEKFLKEEDTFLPSEHIDIFSDQTPLSLPSSNRNRKSGCGTPWDMQIGHPFLLLPQEQW